MELSDADLRGIAAQQEPRVLLHHEVVKFARAIEAEVRKQDDALILQLVEALDDLAEAGEEAWGEKRPCVRIGKESATAGRAWLEHSTQACK